MTIGEIINVLETSAPRALQESYDNAGLIFGSTNWPCTGVLVSLDLTDAVVEEALSKGINLIVSHHPLIFSGLKKIDPEQPTGRILMQCIKKDIAIYAIHTNLDNMLSGVNGRIASLLGLLDTRVLQPLPQTLVKLVVFVPDAHLDKVRQAAWSAGAGTIGQYTNCSFSASGKGSFMAGEGTNPFIGERGKLHFEAEGRLELILPTYLERAVVQAVIAAHPYEEVAYDLYPLKNHHPGIGAGLIGRLPEPIDEKAFLQLLQRVFRIPCIRHTGLKGKSITRVALCGGSGSFLISRALDAGADVFITADLKYHSFFEPDGKMLLADIGHYESEQYTSDLLVELLKEKFPTFAVLKSGLDTNPIHYFYS